MELSSELTDSTKKQVKYVKWVIDGNPFIQLLTIINRRKVYIKYHYILFNTLFIVPFSHSKNHGRME